MHIGIPLSVAAILLFPPTGATADIDSLLEMDFEELVKVEIDTVYGASKTKQRTVDAPANVTIISNEEIKRYSYRTLAEALGNQSGFYTTNDRNYNYIGARGFSSPGDYSTKILVLINGQRINDNLYSSPAVGEDLPIDMDMIDHIEVIRGPGSALYGSSALFAVVNVIPKSGTNFKNGEISLTLGNYGTHKERATFSHTFDDNATLLVSATRYHSDGDTNLYYKEFDDRSTNNGYAQNIDSDNAYKVYMQYKSDDFSLESLYVKRDKDVPTAPWGTVFNKAVNTLDERGFIKANYKTDITEKIDISTGLAYNYYNFTGKYLYEDDGIVSSYDHNPSAWVDGTIDIRYKQNDKLEWLAGVYGMYSIEESLIYDYDGVNYMDINRPINSYAFYLQSLYKASEKLTFNLGLRCDYYDSFGSHLSPRLSAIYALTESSSLKMLYGQAFRAPNGYELNYDDGDYLKGNSALTEETLSSYEIIFEHHFSTKHSLTLNGYYYKMNDLIRQIEDPLDGLLVFKNLDNAESKGVQVDYRLDPVKDIETAYNYTYQYATDAKSNELLVNSPKHLANARVSFPFWEKYRTSLSAQYAGEKIAPNGDNIDDYLIANISVRGDDIVKGLDLSTTVYNLFDTEYAHTAMEEHLQHVIAQDGLSFRVQATYKF